ncbi:MAG: ribosome biogenesis protein ytm1, partial [Watsoniomyces obsoletus]
MLRKHTQQVSGVIFDSKDSTVAYSTSWDQTMRTCDLVTSSVVDTRTTNQALFAVEQMPELQLVATGTAGRDIKLI